jgi:hypothetical protein
MFQRSTTHCRDAERVWGSSMQMYAVYMPDKLILYNWFGNIAQLVEHRPVSQTVRGSIPYISIKSFHQGFLPFLHR